jgi:hypothetical protein
MSRRRRNGDSSLELLLDTITNTFGGVLFLAILVSLLLRTAAPPSATPNNSAEAMSPSEQGAYEVRLEDLQDQVARLQRRSPSNPTPPPTARPDTSREEAERLFAQLAVVLEEHVKVGLQTVEHQRDRLTAIAEVTRLVDRRTSAAERLSTAQQSIKAANSESERLARLSLALECNGEPTTIEQTVGMPTLHKSEKLQVGILVRFSRLYMMHRWRDGVRLGPNAEDFVVTPGTPPIARPKPNAGIAVTTDTIKTDLRNLLRPFPPERWVVAIIVFHDSFAEFQSVKQAIVEAGYEYNPLPVGPGGSVVDTGGEGRAQ